MEKIPKILSISRVSETNGLTRQVIDEYRKGDYSNDSYLTSMIEQLLRRNTELGDAIMRSKTESELAELDNQADMGFTNLHGLSKGYTYHPEENIAKFARQLFALVDKYGLEVKNKSYSEEYPLLNSLLKESQSAEYQLCINNLPGCAQRFTELETSVNAFITKQNEYNSAKDDEKELESASVIKKQVIALINDDLGPYLSAMQKANTGVYGDLATFINNRIAENNAAVRNRGKQDS